MTTWLGILFSASRAKVTWFNFCDEIMIKYNKSTTFNHVFNEVGGWRVGERQLWFSLNNFSLLWPIDTKLAVWVAYIKAQLWIATHVLWLRSRSLLLKIGIQFRLNIFSLLWPINTKLGVWVAYIKAQLWIATHVLWLRSRSLLLKIEIQFSLNNFSLLWPIDIKLGVWVAYIKTQLGIATQVYVIKVMVPVLKIEIQFPLINFSMLWPIDTKLATNATKMTASFFLHCHLSFLIPVTSLLDWIVENLVSSHCGASCLSKYYMP